MNIQHHPDFSSLMSCAAGSQPEAIAAVMAAHVSMCPKCAAELHIMEEIGITLFEDMAAAPLKRAAPVIAARANEAGSGATSPAAANGDVPAHLVPLVGQRLADVAWSRIGRGVWQHSVPLSKGARGDLRLVKIAPGVAVPDHGHYGTELTLLLQGSYRDKRGEFRTGDLEDVDADVEHQPIADPAEGCICLIASEKPARFKSLLARLVQPFIGM